MSWWSRSSYIVAGLNLALSVRDFQNGAPGHACIGLLMVAIGLFAARCLEIPDDQRALS
jgi:hypothetical protein